MQNNQYIDRPHYGSILDAFLLVNSRMCVFERYSTTAAAATAHIESKWSQNYPSNGCQFTFEFNQYSQHTYTHAKRHFEDLTNINFENQNFEISIYINSGERCTDRFCTMRYCNITSNLAKKHRRGFNVRNIKSIPFHRQNIKASKQLKGNSTNSDIMICKNIIFTAMILLIFEFIINIFIFLFSRFLR